MASSQPTTTSPLSDLDGYAKRLSESADINVKLQCLNDLRDALEGIRDFDYERFLKAVLPVLSRLLDPQLAVFRRDAPEQKLRHAALDLLHRLPQNETFRQYANDILALLIQLVRHDNEENGVWCIKIIIDLNRTYKEMLQMNVRGFLHLVHEIYRNGPRAVQKAFEESEDAESFKDDPNIILPCMSSFKVLLECPIVVVLVIQHIKQLVPEITRSYLPEVIEFLQAQAPAQKIAHEEAAARNERQIGMSSNVKNRGLYNDLLTAQVKTMSFLAYVLRASTQESLHKYATDVPQICVRLMQDTPSESAVTRKELLIAVRHILNTDIRSHFRTVIDSLLDERILIGTGLTVQETLRSYALSIIVDLIHHVRYELTFEQLESVVSSYTFCLQNPSLGGVMHTMSAKLLLNLVEPLERLQDKTSSVKTLMTVLEAYVQKLKGLECMGLDLMTMEQDSTSNELMSRIAVEKEKPVASIAFVHESLAEVRRETRLLVRTILYGTRTVLQSIRKLEGPGVGADIMGRVFQGVILCMEHFDRNDPREEKEVLEVFGAMLKEIEAHVLQEVWTTHMDFFFEKACSDGTLLTLPQKLMGIQEMTHQMVSIFLGYLIGRLPELGEQDQDTAAVTLKLFKIVFTAISAYPEINERVLLPHLPGLIMDSFPLAAKATEPTSYFLLLRTLFRAIGGGRFEALYLEVLPLLQEMLESFNQFMDYVDPAHHDLLVELSLTVPVRLTHLLPHLALLMKPLVAGLRGTPELVAQGLRTLELCVDNLTTDFLEPIIRPVYSELMGALHSHLKPYPYPNNLSQVCTRILGKLGGRNRRFSDLRHTLECRAVGDDAALPISFDTSSIQLDIGPAVELAARTIRHSNAFYRREAFDFLKECIRGFLRNGVHSPEQILRYEQALLGLFETVKVDEFRLTATTFIRDLAKLVFQDETQKGIATPLSSRRIWGTLVTGFLDGMTKSLACAPSQRKDEVLKVVEAIVQDMNVARQPTDPTGTHNAEYTALLGQLGSRFVGLCYHSNWFSKLAGYSGLTLMACGINLGPEWVQERQIEIIQGLLSVLRETPYGAPQYVQQITDTILTVARIGHQVHGPKDKAAYIMGRVMVHELASPNLQVREAAQTVLQLYSDLEGQPVSQLLRSYRDRLLTSIYTKPLRALPFSTQIGHIDAMTYCLNLRPAFVEVNDELLRLLSEALALADAEDQTLIGKTPQRKNTLAVVDLRVVCIKLLTASMSVTDFMAKQAQTRQRVTGVYFKSLYSASPQVKTVAYEGLKLVLAHQNKLPKDTLQAGLKPILMNLADARRLSVPNLEGLARLLELLTNYFKVEIGVKLIDHFKALSEPHMLRDSAFSPLSTNDDIKKLVRLVNVFHLLPQTANSFLADVLKLVVQTETSLHASGPTPFTEPMARFLNRFPSESLRLLLENIKDVRYVSTLRNCLISSFAPMWCEEFERGLPQLIETCFQGRDLNFIIPGLLLCRDMVKISPRWVLDRPELLRVLRTLWCSSTFEDPGLGTTWPITALHQAAIMTDIFMVCLEQEHSVSLLVDLVLLYTRKVAMDITSCSRFIHDFLIRNDTKQFKRDIFKQCLDMLDDKSISWDHKTHFIRLVVNPMLLIACNCQAPDDFIDVELINQVHAKVWHPMAIPDSPPFPDSAPAFLVELLHLSTLLVRFCPQHIHDTRKDLVKCGWNLITNEDVILKQTAYVLLAQFLQHWDSPTKIVMRVWAGLVRTHNVEGRALTRQALDILAPALPKRMPNEGIPPAWAKNTRRVLLEESGSVSQMTSVYHLIIRHPDLFYSSRDLFVPHMVSSLFKLGMASSPTGPTPAGPTAETRSLSIDVVELVVRWERQATVPMDGFPVQTESVQRPQNEGMNAWSMPVALKETVVSFLVRFICTSPDPISSGGTVGRAHALLINVLGPDGWTNVNVLLSFLSRSLVQADFTIETSVMFRNTATVLAAVAERKSDAWFISNATALHELLRKSILSDDTSLHESLEPVVTRMFQALPEPTQPSEEHEPMDEDMEWFAWAEATIEEGLRNSNRARGALFLLQAWAHVRPDKVDAFAGALLQLMKKLVVLHTQSKEPQPDEKAHTGPICAILQLYQGRFSFSPEPRRHLFPILTALVDKSNSTFVCRSVLDVARKWVFERAEGAPTLKDCALLLSRMVCLEQKTDESLGSAFLELVYDIYAEPRFHRTELTVRLEAAFLKGCKYKDPFVRNRFLELLDGSIPRLLPHRMQYVFASLSWESIADSYWLYQALDLILGSTDEQQLPAPTPDTTDQGEDLATLMRRETSYPAIRLLRRLVWLDSSVTHRLWLSSFKSFWICLSRKAQIDMVAHIISQLKQSYHLKQVGKSPNVIQSLLGGMANCSPPLGLPPHLIKFLGKTYNAWHDAIEQLRASLELVKDDDGFHDGILDSLTEMYSELSEEDMFYGVWRRRCLHTETNIALSFEQNGLWKEAVNVYENAQQKARNTGMATAEAEHCLWEDHWILGQQKLQQWDLLLEYSRNVSDSDLILECSWQKSEWSNPLDREHIERALESVDEHPTPRRSVFEAFLSILKWHASTLPADLNNFNAVMDRATQLALRKWSALPEMVSVAHVPLFHHFQQLVELQESRQIFNSISSTNEGNLERRSSELKVILQGWRERLPNAWDDIHIWSDLVAWRQHMFQVINKAYLPLIGKAPSAGTATANSNTYGYRGYHEMAWIINRFAHVARKHELWDVCHNSLTKIYTLPNIEISEAFLKLREQARCHFQRGEIQSGLEVINNTNLIYFSAAQKAEFFTMKGMFIAKANMMEEAYAAFSQAVKTDINLPKAWAEWGRFCDRLYRVKSEVQLAAHAVTSYLQAAGMYKNPKARPLLARVLWLLRADSAEGQIAQAFDSYRGDGAHWWWVHLIPQLLMSLSHREAKQARQTLIQLAKIYPQALFFQLRTARDDEANSRRMRDKEGQARNAQTASGSATALVKEGGSADDTQVALRTSTTVPPGTATAPVKDEPGGHGEQPSANTSLISGTPTVAPINQTARQPWDYFEEITSILKTAFPLLALTMESLVEQFVRSFKPPPEEDLMRYLNNMVIDGLTTWANRSTAVTTADTVPPTTMEHIMRFAPILPESNNIRGDFIKDFVESKPTLREHLGKLILWRDRYEKSANERNKKGSLDTLSYHLAEFQHMKYDDIEIPGQYLKYESTNAYFFKISRFKSTYESTGRGALGTFRRVTILGTNGSEYGFAVQYPAPRHGRREERIAQLFRILNSVLESRKETKKRGLFFHVPAAIPMASTVRLFESDPSSISFQDIIDDSMAKRGWSREHAVVTFSDKMREICLEAVRNGGKPVERQALNPFRLLVLEEVQTKVLPENVMSNYFTRSYPFKKDLWYMRKQFTLQLAAQCFLTYVFNLTNRLPARFNVARTTGNIYMTDTLPALYPSSGPLLTNKAGEVPFRFTPNLQHFVTPHGAEGILPVSLLSMARAICEPEYDLDLTLGMYMRDEVLGLQNNGQAPLGEQQFRQFTSMAIENISKRVDLLACKLEREKGANSTSPVHQTVNLLIAAATNPAELARMGELSMPWF